MAKAKGRELPRLDVSVLEPNFEQQALSGEVADSSFTDGVLPPLQSARGQALRIDRCLLRSVSVPEPKARGLRMRDVRMESSQLANVDWAGGSFERVEIVSTRLTGSTFTEAKLKSVLFQECKLDLAVWRMAAFERCVFERCNLVEADFYGADLTGAVLHGCDLSGADVSHAKLAGADLRECRLDGMRGKPESMEGLVISPDQAALLITLFGVRVEW